MAVAVDDVIGPVLPARGLRRRHMPDHVSVGSCRDSDQRRHGTADRSRRRITNTRGNDAVSRPSPGRYPCLRALTSNTTRVESWFCWAPTARASPRTARAVAVCAPPDCWWRRARLRHAERTAARCGGRTGDADSSGSVPAAKPRAGATALPKSAQLPETQVRRQALAVVLEPAITAPHVGCLTRGLLARSTGAQLCGAGEYRAESVREIIAVSSWSESCFSNSQRRPRNSTGTRLCRARRRAADRKVTNAELVGHWSRAGTRCISTSDFMSLDMCPPRADDPRFHKKAADECGRQGCAVAGACRVGGPGRQDR